MSQHGLPGHTNDPSLCQHPVPKGFVVRGTRRAGGTPAVRTCQEEVSALTRRTSRIAAVVATFAVVSWLPACQGSAAPDDASESPTPSAASSSPDHETTDPSEVSNGVPALDDPRIAESSGITRSTVHDGVFYTHNDRGSAPDIFAVDRTGTRAVLEVDVPALDWEDIASTPDGRIWVADIGDNDKVRSSVSLVVVDEPDVLVSALIPATTYELSYPDGPHDAEALLIDPGSRRVYIVTKAERRGRIYAAPAELDPRGNNVLELVGFAPNNITAGDFSPDGSMAVLRNQGKAFFYGELGESPTEVTLPDQPQGESVTFTADGAQVLLGSEGADSTLLRLRVPQLED